MNRSTSRAVKKLVKVTPLAIIGASLLIMWVLVPIASATHLGGGAFHDPATGIATQAGIIKAIQNVARFLFTGFLALAVVFLIIAALFYITAAGNQTQLDRSKNILIYSIIAIVIALVAGGVTSFIDEILGTRLQ